MTRTRCEEQAASKVPARGSPLKEITSTMRLSVRHLPAIEVVLVRFLELSAVPAQVLQKIRRDRQFEQDIGSLWSGVSALAMSRLLRKGLEALSVRRIPAGGSRRLCAQPPGA